MEEELYDWLLEARQQGCFEDIEISQVLTDDRSAMQLYDDFVQISPWDKLEMVRRVTKKIQEKFK